MTVLDEQPGVVADPIPQIDVGSARQKMQPGEVRVTEDHEARPGRQKGLGACVLCCTEHRIGPPGRVTSDATEEPPGAVGAHRIHQSSERAPAQDRRQPAVPQGTVNFVAVSQVYAQTVPRLLDHRRDGGAQLISEKLGGVEVMVARYEREREGPERVDHGAVGRERRGAEMPPVLKDVTEEAEAVYPQRREELKQQGLIGVIGAREVGVGEQRDAHGGTFSR